VDNKIDALAQFNKALEIEAKKDFWYEGDTIWDTRNEIIKFLGKLPFEEKKRITEAVISPETAGRVYIRYQKPTDYVDHDDLMTLEPELLNQSQHDRPLIVDCQFFVDLERVMRIISGLNNEELLR
jgi:hypothetical protein